MAAPKRCPICGKDLPDIEKDAPFRPFCSKRCKAIDFGSWLDGRYRISRPLAEQDLDAGVELPTEDGDPPTDRSGKKH